MFDLRSEPIIIPLIIQRENNFISIVHKTELCSSNYSHGIASELQ